MSKKDIHIAKSLCSGYDKYFIFRDNGDEIVVEIIGKILKSSKPLTQEEIEYFKKKH